MGDVGIVGGDGDGGVNGGSSVDGGDDYGGDYGGGVDGGDDGCCVGGDDYGGDYDGGGGCGDNYGCDDAGVGGDDVIDGDVGADDDGGRGALNWRMCKCLAVWVHAPLFLPNNFKSPPNLPIYIFFNTRSAPVWILCQIICNRPVARIALQPQ